MGSDGRHSSSFVRLWNTFMTARIAVAALLFVLQASAYVLGQNKSIGILSLCLAYLCATTTVRFGTQPKAPGNSFDAQWLLTIGFDVIVFAALEFWQPGGVNYTPLFALPVLLAAILGPVLLALGTAASVTLFLLFDAWRLSLQTLVDPTMGFLQAGSSSFAFFIVAVLANQLVQRGKKEEQRAQKSQSFAYMQTQVNQLVIETLTDGVLVVDVNGMIRAANPAAHSLLDHSEVVPGDHFLLASRLAWQPLLDVVAQTFRQNGPVQERVSLDGTGGGVRHLLARTQLVASGHHELDSLCVMFIEDLREMEARVRHEKMAAMGRMSVAVAHEIRNPLAAIAQANALLEEELQGAEHQQLTGIVRQNTKRLARMVEDILNVSRVSVDTSELGALSLPLDAAVAQICDDWVQQNAAQTKLKRKSFPCDVWVHFETEHLRRLMVNLMDNALRHASGAVGSIQVYANKLPSNTVRLSVWSDGGVLEKTVERHLFEPFFSSESRSSGLGLYICRELCERYSAQIGYQRLLHKHIPGNEFFVLLKQTIPTQATKFA